MNKGFTLVELLAVIVILAIISGIGIVSFTGLTDNSKSDYYDNLKNNLQVVASSYFTEHRSLRPGIDEVCNKTTIKELIDNKLIEGVTNANGESCDLENSYVYIKRNNDKQYEYNVSLICGNDRFLIDEESYCTLTEEPTTTIVLSAVDSNNNDYVITRSYNNTSWIKTNVRVTFSSTTSVTKYMITNTNTGDVYTCDATSNSCSYEFSVRGIYNVVSYNNEEVVSHRDFNIKIDKTKPTFTLKETGNFNIPDGNILVYKNSLDNIVDESGIARVNYELIKGGVTVVNETINSTNIEIRNLSSGNYKIRIKAYDQVLNESDILEKDFYISRNIKLIDPLDESYNETHQVLDGTHYNYLGQNLPILTKAGYEFLGWYTTSSGDVKISDTSMVATTSVALYARWS